MVEYKNILFATDLSEDANIAFFHALDLAKKHDAKILNFYSYEDLQNTNSNSVHYVGFNYRMNSKDYNELSYFVECKGKKKNLVHIKGLTQDDLVALRRFTDRISKTFDCL